MHMPKIMMFIWVAIIFSSITMVFKNYPWIYLVYTVKTFYKLFDHIFVPFSITFNIEVLTQSLFVVYYMLFNKK